jgi:MFS transporter, DHA1 family, tetracycline resistance protein
MTHAQPSPRQPSLYALLPIVFVSMAGFGLLVPILPFLALKFGATGTETTWLLGVYSLGQFFAAPLWGRLSDRIGRRPVLLVSLVGIGVSYLFLAWSSNIYEMGAARLFGGLMAGNIGAAFAYASDVSGPKDRAKSMGLIGASFGLGFIVGPALGGWLAGAEPEIVDFHRVCYAAAGAVALALVIALFSLKESLTAELRAQQAHSAQGLVPEGTLKLLARPVLATLVIVMLLITTAQALMESSFGLWADAVLQWGPHQLGFVFMGVGVISALLQGGASGRLAGRFGERRVVAAGIGILGLGFVGLGFATTPGFSIAAMVLLAIGVGLIGPALTSLVSQEAADHERGRVMGLQQSAGSLSRVLGPLMAGPLFDAFGPSSPFLFGSVLVAGGGVFLWWSRRKRLETVA